MDSPEDEAMSGVEAETLAERVYRQLKRAIRMGTFRPGQKMTNRAVASALNVSATPAREALVRLVSEDVLEMIGPKTIIVPHLSPSRYQEIATIRMALEGIAAEAAAAHVTDRFIDDLEMVHLAFVSARSNRDYVEALQMNEQFHFMIYRRSQMPRLVSIIENLWAASGPSFRLLYPKFADHRDGAQQHGDAIAGLRARDPQRVRASIEQDIRIGTSKLLAILGRQAAGSPNVADNTDTELAPRG